MKIGLIGDHIIDIYIHGTVDRISPESPIPIFSQEHTETKYGGSGNVYNNLKAFGAEVEYFRTSDNNCSVKTRYVSQNHILFRSDKEPKDTVYLTDFNFSDEIEVVVLSDYNKGYLYDINNILPKLENKFTIVDPKRPLQYYMGANIIKLNEKEFEAYSEYNDPVDAAKVLVKTAIIITRADKSVLIAYNDGRLETVENENIQVADVTGAGDVFIAALAYYVANKLSLKEAVEKATKLASLSVTKFGTYVLTEEDIKSLNKTTVFTNGCFDIIHRGHIEYLKASRALGDKLVVGLNSDASVKRLKGAERPINNQEDRKAILETFDFVDEVIIFDEDTPYKTIQKIAPDIITKGGDYKKETVVGNDLAKVVIIPFVEGYSTTNILERVNG